MLDANKPEDLKDISKYVKSKRISNSQKIWITNIFKFLHTRK